MILLENIFLVIWSYIFCSLVSIFPIFSPPSKGVLVFMECRITRADYPSTSCYTLWITGDYKSMLFFVCNILLNLFLGHSFVFVNHVRIYKIEGSTFSWKFIPLVRNGNNTDYAILSNISSQVPFCKGAVSHFWWICQPQSLRSVAE